MNEAINIQIQDIDTLQWHRVKRGLSSKGSDDLFHIPHNANKSQHLIQKYDTETEAHIFYSIYTASYNFRITQTAYKIWMCLPEWEKMRNTEFFPRIQLFTGDF